MFSKRNLTFFLGTLFLGIAIAIGAWPATGDSSSPSRDPGLRTVRVDTVDQTRDTRDVRLPGITRAAQRAALAFTVPARVAERPVEIGDRVRTGQVLARLDASEFTLANRGAEAALAELDARLDQARREEARVERLAAARAATAEELEKAQSGTSALVAARDAAASRVDETRRLLSETVLRAPFDGTVTRVKVEPGEWASPGATVIELSGTGVVEVRVEVPESLRGSIAVSTPARVALPMSGRTVVARVTSVSEAAAGAGSLFPVIVAVEPDAGVVSGMTAEVVLSLSSAASLTVPLASVLDSGSSRPAVFRIDGGNATRVAIRPGRLVGDRLTVTADGLEEGDLVAIAGHTALVDGDRVEVR
jgi:RND family efflux transporter MFP subunit